MNLLDRSKDPNLVQGIELLTVGKLANFDLLKRVTSVLRLTCFSAYSVLSLFRVTRNTLLYAPSPMVTHPNESFTCLTYLLLNYEVSHG